MSVRMLIAALMIASIGSASASTVLDTDVLVVGGGAGGVSAALAATRNGSSVVMLEETDWPGGQFTSQGVSCPDEHSFIETVANTSLAAFRRLVREYYSLGYRLSEKGRAMKYLNPGYGWVSPLCHEPRAGVAAIDQLLKPAVDSGKLRVFLNTSVTTVSASRGTVREVTAVRASGQDSTTSDVITIRPRYVIEATPLGDFLEMAGVPFSVGLESKAQTGEEHAYPGKPDPRGVQGLTSCFAVEFCPGENHVIPKPPLYERFLAKKRYGLGAYSFIKPTSKSPSPFWTYRRLVAAELFDDPRVQNDIAMINWASNDYHERDLIGASPAERLDILDEAKQQSLGFLYWLQTECPRDGGGKGYPELKLRPDVMGTSDGLSMFPYIRESRRIKALTTICEGDVSATGPLPRARIYDDSVGVGNYYLVDIHTCVGDPRSLAVPIQGTVRAKPFQIPLGALIPAVGGNVLAGQKNLGVTHVANGAYRMHPTEWSVGEAAGTLASFCLEHGATPAEVRGTRKLLRKLQVRLLNQGVPLFWYSDLKPDDPAFLGAQMLAIEGDWIADPAKLEFSGTTQLTADQREDLAARLKLQMGDGATRGDVATTYSATIAQ